MFHKICSGIALLLTLLAGSFIATRSTFAAPELTSYQETDSHVSFDYWYNETDSNYSGGAIRYGDESGEKASFVFSGTAITWVTSKGPYAGSAKVMIDGKKKGVFALYATTNEYQHRIKFSGLANGKHTIVIKVLGRGGPVSSFQEVALDAFIVGGTTTQETSNAIVYGKWKSKHNSNANGGTFRVSGKKGDLVMFGNNAGQVQWVTATGPSYGKAEVILNGVSQGVVDLYSPTPQWGVVKSFTQSGPGGSNLIIQVLGEKNPASTGTQVVIDAFNGD